MPFPQLQTRSIHSGIYKDSEFSSVTTPIYMTSCFAFSGIDEPPPFDYTRSGNPTRQALNENLAALENAYSGFALSSGMAAIHTVLMLLGKDQHVIYGKEVYGGTYRLFNKVFPRFGLSFTPVDTSNLEEIAAAIRPETALIWIETPSNPLLNLTNLESLVTLAREHQLMTCVDNTFMSPVLQCPIELGVDIVVHSTTKYLNGHSDVIGGAVLVRTEPLAEKIAFLVNALGVGQSPFDAWLVLRGIKTLVPRVQCAQDSAGKIALWLQEQPEVKKVFYPGLPQHPHYELAKKQQKGAGAMITAELDTHKVNLDAFFKAMKLFHLSVSLGGVESLIEQPATMSHATFTDEARAKAGITPGIVRFSIGCEHFNDLIAELDHAFKVAKL